MRSFAKHIGSKVGLGFTKSLFGAHGLWKTLVCCKSCYVPEF